MLSATVRATPNNEESSRSQLFIVFSVKRGDGVRSTFTVVDMAGVENPVALVNTFWTGPTVMAFTRLHPKVAQEDRAF